ncbi:hypothetical protein RPN242_gp081 [Escherichia phage vB_EcoM-RPN242]|nr:hypothetical protein RPN242_gp081 [Escherichia phage vB_EcoM-RPN242]
MTLEELNKLDDGEVVRGYLKSREGVCPIWGRVSEFHPRLEEWSGGLPWGTNQC